MTQDEKDQDLAVLAFLKGLGCAGASEERDAPTMPQPTGNGVDAFLRAMGYNRIERERLRRGQPRPRNEDRHRATTVKRFKYHIAQALTDRTTEEVAELATAWVSLTDYNLDLAQRWWQAGVDPGTPGQFAKAIEDGLRVEDLGEVVAGGQTIAEHLQAGNSLVWCLGALHWKRSA